MASMAAVERAGDTWELACSDAARSDRVVCCLTLDPGCNRRMGTGPSSGGAGKWIPSCGILVFWTVEGRLIKFVYFLVR